VYKAGQALAAIRGRDHVLPDDIKTLAVPVLAHRLMLKPEAELRGRKDQEVVQRLLEETPLHLQTSED
jgi:MoxR-like ATPase